MISLEKLMATDKDHIQQIAKDLAAEDLPQLIGWLSEKDDKIRYQALLLLQQRSSTFSDVYPFWDIFKDKLKSENSYQRSIGLMLIADNAKWDTDNRIDEAIGGYLALLNDEKPITVRQCIQALSSILPAKPHLCPLVGKSLMEIDIMASRETMRKSILMDLLNILILIRTYHPSDEVEAYISDALAGNILDKKSKKQIEAAM